MLICSPIIGWVVVGVGLVVGGYVGSKTTELVDYIWDPENRKEAWEKVKTWGAAAEEYVVNAWTSQRDWILSFYGS